MVTLDRVEGYLKDSCGMALPRGYDRRREICQVEMLGAGTVFQRDTLYLFRSGTAVPEGAEGVFLPVEGQREEEVYRGVRRLLDGEAKAEEIRAGLVYKA